MRTPSFRSITFSLISLLCLSVIEGKEIISKKTFPEESAAVFTTPSTRHNNIRGGAVNSISLDTKTKIVTEGVSPDLKRQETSEIKKRELEDVSTIGGGGMFSQISGIALLPAYLWYILVNRGTDDRNNIETIIDGYRGYKVSKHSSDVVGN